MNKVELTRTEFRWLLVGVMWVPVTLFIIGLNVGLGLYTSGDQDVASVARVDPQEIPQAGEQVASTLESEPMVDEPLTQVEALTETVPEVAAVEPGESNQNPGVVEQLDEMYGVQVGSFGKLENAQGLKQTMVNQGYDAQVVNDGGRYRVVIATYSTRDEAKQAELEYETQNHADAYVTMVHHSTLVLTVATVAG